MVIYSGILLDYDTNIGISGGNISIVSTQTSGVLCQLTTSPIGTFFIDLLVSSGNLIFTPIVNNYINYSKYVYKDVTFVTLFSRKTSQVPSASGTLFSNMYNQSITTSDTIRDITNVLTNFYVITDNGLDIIDRNTYNNVGYILHSGGFTSISVHKPTASVSGLLLGTSYSGVYKYIPPSEYDINNREIDFSQLLQIYKQENSTLLSNRVDCMHQNINKDIVIGTESGIDYYSSSGNHYFHQYSSGIGTTACFISDYGDIYYSPTNSGLYVKYATITGNWTEPDYIVELSGTGLYPFPLLSNYINDVVVTSVSGAENNHVFIATQSGLVVYTEDADLNISASGAKLFRSFT